MDFTVVSFYTNDWLYPDYAAKLKEDCDRLGIPHHIIEKPSTNRYVGNCQIKAFFIKECMESFKSPLLWIDADGSILKKPAMLYEEINRDYDLVGNRPINDPSRIHVGSMLLNYTAKMSDFVEVWCEGIKRKDPLDDAAFNGTWDVMKNSVRFRELPQKYFYIQKNPYDPVPADTIILHRLSKSDLKQRYKVEGR